MADDITGLENLAKKSIWVHGITMQPSTGCFVPGDPVFVRIDTVVAVVVDEASYGARTADGRLVKLDKDEHLKLGLPIQPAS